MIKLTNKVYDVIKWLITIALPATGALYFALAQVWDFNRIPGVNGTINAVIAFLGILTGISTRQYNNTTGAPDGDLIVSQVDGEKYLRLAVNTSVEAMTSKDTVKLHVMDKTATDPKLVIPTNVPIVTPGVTGLTDPSGTTSSTTNPATSS